ncbi:MAG: glycosyltransferase family 2 protein [Candidatus Latescibacterota bacterium]|nr:glycosyltransferase family 2 protein [Candidatus Latescibacterota bacterium]
MTEVGRPPVAAALANWNGAPYLERCLTALRAQTHPLQQIVVVDNGSTDGSNEWLANQPDVTLIRRPHNEGYCRGYNLAIDATRAPYVLTLNTDAFLDSEFVSSCLAAMEASPGCAAATGQFDEQATGLTIGGGFGLGRLMRMKPTDALDDSAEVFGVTGAAALYRRDALQNAKIDGQVYDECYFSYGEDIDLAWRLYLMGWHSIYAPAARAYHVGSGSLHGTLRFFDNPSFFQRQALRNRYLTLMKNARGLDGLRLLLTMAVGECALWPYLLVRQPLRFPALLKVPLELLVRLPRVWRWRRITQRRRNRHVGSIRRWIRGW